MKRILAAALLLVASLPSQAQDSLTATAPVSAQASSPENEKIDILRQSSFTDIYGKTYSLNDFKGKAVVFHFWENGASRSVKSMQDLYRAQDHHRDRVVVIAINVQSLDKPENIRRFAEENIYSFIYIPDSRKITHALHIEKIPYKIFLDEQGNLVESFSGAYPDVREFQRNKAVLEKCLSKQD
jgi:cytochrome c biogenesis protein CcmG, thiol:disulfide interchange protein DsbE